MPTLARSLSACALAIALASACSSNPGTPPPPPPVPPSNLPALVNIKATVSGDTAAIEFDPVAGARDYRVYPQPAAADVIDAGIPAIKNALYRCAGVREAPTVPTDNQAQVGGGAVQTFVNHAVKNFTRVTADATLGYVRTTPATGFAPVYALGDPATDGDNLCFFQRWNETRVKKYITSDSDRATLLGAGFRDDGIVFYVPAAGSAGTRVISAAVVDGAQLYFNDGPELAARSAASPAAAFSVLTAAADGTEPLLRVHYQNGCGRSHDELVAGQARFDHAVHQGNTPVTSVTWSGLTGQTRLVVEALDGGCPFQAHLSPQSFPSYTTKEGIAHQAWRTIAEVRATSSNGEVFINGQHDDAGFPSAIAQSYVDVSPDAGSYDFYDGFSDGTSPGPLTELLDAGFQSAHFDSPNYDLTLYSVEKPNFSIGQVQGELWITYADWAADTNGKIRLTPKKKATIAAHSYLHATMEVDTVSTSRRYPQMLISDRSPPIQDVLDQGTTLVVQTFGEWPPRIDIELCDHRIWDVNRQCPHFTVQPQLNEGALPPHAELGERSGIDRRNRLDVYASTGKVYVLLDGQPWACAALPASAMPAGPVSVTYGDVLYHSGADVADPPYHFHHEHLFVETQRHFDELGFKSGVAAPTWNETALPCSSTMVCPNPPFCL